MTQLVLERARESGRLQLPESGESGGEPSSGYLLGNKPVGVWLRGWAATGRVGANMGAEWMLCNVVSRYVFLVGNVP